MANTTAVPATAYGEIGPSIVGYIAHFRGEWSAEAGRHWVCLACTEEIKPTVTSFVIEQPVTEDMAADEGGYHACDVCDLILSREYALGQGYPLDTVCKALA